VALEICFETSFFTSFLSEGPPSTGEAIASAAISATAIVTVLHLGLRVIELSFRDSPASRRPFPWSDPLTATGVPTTR
jgi:hypothetical protein